MFVRVEGVSIPWRTQNTPLLSGGRRWYSLLNWLPECNPETVAVADNEFPHTIERVVKVFNDLGFAIEAEAQTVHIINMGI